MIEKRSIRFCPPFRINKVIVGEAMSNADEFLINYNPNKNRQKNLFEFFENYPDQRINLNWLDGLTVEEAALISKVNDKVVHRINAIQDLPKIDGLKEKKLPFYFDKMFPAHNWTQLEGFASIGVTDIFIADDLTFQLSAVRQYCDKYNIRIRTILDRISSSMLLSKKLPIYFPQDIDFMAIYYDVAELETTDDHTIKVLYDIWFNQKKWLGNLQEINPDLPFPFPAYSIPSRYVRYRSNCHQRCLKGSNCKECEKMQELAYDFAEKGVRIEVKNDTNKKAI